MALGAQETSPRRAAARGGAGAPSSNPKPFPPPVGRFPGDPSNGNNWNGRSQSMPRSNGAGGNGDGHADGISNYGGAALNRRSSTPGKPPIAGACGLVNVGNTCYLNSAVQCLSHTPLVRAYLLSDMWAAEVNKYNPLGTQVRQARCSMSCHRRPAALLSCCPILVPLLFLVYSCVLCFPVCTAVVAPSSGFFISLRRTSRCLATSIVEHLVSAGFSRVCLCGAVTRLD